MCDDLFDEIRGHRGHIETEEIADLRHGDNDRDPAGEAYRHWVGDELDHVSEPGETHEDHESPGHHRRDR